MPSCKVINHRAEQVRAPPMRRTLWCVLGAALRATAASEAQMADDDLRQQDHRSAVRISLTSVGVGGIRAPLRDLCPLAQSHVTIANFRSSMAPAILPRSFG
jgi:hypothetical protein